METALGLYPVKCCCCCSGCCCCCVACCIILSDCSLLKTGSGLIPDADSFSLLTSDSAICTREMSTLGGPSSLVVVFEGGRGVPSLDDIADDGVAGGGGELEEEGPEGYLNLGLLLLPERRRSLGEDWGLFC